MREIPRMLSCKKCILSVRKPLLEKSFQGLEEEDEEEEKVGREIRRKNNEWGRSRKMGGKEKEQRAN